MRKRSPPQADEQFILNRIVTKPSNIRWGFETGSRFSRSTTPAPHNPHGTGSNHSRRYLQVQAFYSSEPPTEMKARKAFFSFAHFRRNCIAVYHRFRQLKFHSISRILNTGNHIVAFQTPHPLIVVVKKRFGIQTFFSTTTYIAIPYFVI